MCFLRPYVEFHYIFLVDNASNDSFQLLLTAACMQRYEHHSEYALLCAHGVVDIAHTIERITDTSILFVREGTTQCYACLKLVHEDHLLSQLSLNHEYIVMYMKTVRAADLTTI